MEPTSAEKLSSHLQVGGIYRREMLVPFSKSIDRDLKTLMCTGILKKVAPGLYYKIKTSPFGHAPPDEEKLVRCFLREDTFLLFSWNDYNSLGVGLTQFYNRWVVYNHKRKGLFKLGYLFFEFHVPPRGFPNKLTSEFLLVDLLHHLDELGEDTHFIKPRLRQRIHQQFNAGQVLQYVREYAKPSVRRFFEAIIHEHIISSPIIPDQSIV